MSYIPYIAAGVKDDFEKFLACFQKEQSVRFTHFADVWREMNFSFLFCGRESECELLEFTEEVLMIALDYVMPLHTFQVRAAGLYLLYAVYMKQKSTIKAKIRVTLSQWKELQHFVSEIICNNHHDLHYVYRKLEMNYAFHFVCFQKEHAPLHRTLDNVSTETHHTSMIKNLTEDGQLKDLQEIHNRYYSIKSKLIESRQLIDAAYITPDLISNISKRLMDFEKKTLHSQNDSGQESSENNTKDEEIGARRKKLKKKLMEQTATASRSRRHRETEIETVGGKHRAPKKTGRTKRSLKRTTINYSENEISEGELSINELKESMPILSSQNDDDLTTTSAKDSQPNSAQLETD